MGCAGDWTPGCEAAKLTLRADGIYAGTFDVPAGDYEYKVALNGSWDVNYGANGEPNGGNIAYTHRRRADHVLLEPEHQGGLLDRRGPRGDAARQLPVRDRMPRRLAARVPRVAHAGRRQGRRVHVRRPTTIPDGSYEVKVAHGLSWDENYGVGGVPGGGELLVHGDDGKLVEFRYTLATHVLEIVVTDPPLAGTGESRAHWVSEDTLAVAGRTARRGIRCRRDLDARALARRGARRRRRRRHGRRRADRARARPGRPLRRAAREVPAARGLPRAAPGRPRPRRGAAAAHRAARGRAVDG